MKRRYATIPDNISRSHIIQAIELMRKDGIPQDRMSSTYVVEFEGEYFPPPLTVGKANLYANGDELGGPGKHVKGGRGTKCFAVLEKAGFNIRRVAELEKKEVIAESTEFSFALESHLEEFLIRNWGDVEFGKDYDLLRNSSGDLIGQQYQTDTGPIDLLAISKDRRSYLVIELKRARSSDSTVGQILRYMAYIKDEEAEADQSVKGIIVAHSEDPKARRATSMVPDVSFWQYQLSFEVKEL